MIVGLAAATSLQAARDRWYPTIASPVDELYFTNGDAVGRLALSYKSLLSDIYWIRAVQYFGSTRIEARRSATQTAPATAQYDLLYPLLDVTTSLDPSFNIAYRFGSIFLAEEYPLGPGRPELAIKLLDKGFAANPRKWQYVYDKAFVYSWALHDPEAGGALVQRSREGAGIARMDARHGRVHAGAGRRPAQLANAVAADPRCGRARVRPRQRRVSSAAARCRWTPLTN